METKNMRCLCAVLLLLFGSHVSAQSIFEKAVSGDSVKGGALQQNYDLNGYIRGVFYGGKVPEEDEAEIKSGYGEAALRLRVRKQELGDGFAEIRFRRGNEFGAYVSELSLREAYVNMYIGPLDVRFGHQIVVWGRADGFNPTDNITPKDMLARSPDEDDRRVGNFLVRTHCNIHPFRLEGIWVPFYASSVIPTNIIPFPSGITMTEPEYPGANLKNSAIAAKLNLELASFDGSLSYFNGYNPFPGVDATAPDLTAGGIAISVFPKAYRMHVVGADFSTTFASMGLRGEIAYRRPHENHKKFVFIPNSDLQYILGGDKEFGDLSILLQYVGRYVFDFEETIPPQNPVELMNYELGMKNRMLTGQQHEVSHSVSFRPALKLMYETLDVELLGLFNFTTQELFLKPKISYDIADELTFVIGGEIYSGPDETLYGMVDEALSSLFVELRTSF